VTAIRQQTVSGLPASALRQACDPQQFAFETTADLPEPPAIVEQARATSAIRFGIAIPHGGFNLFVLGPTGIGKRFVSERELVRQADTMPIPNDLCYVNNFGEPNRPRLLTLPAGTGKQLHDDMNRLVEDIATALPAAFDGEDYHSRLHALEDQAKALQADALEAVEAEAKSKGLAMLPTPVGMMFAPVVDNEILQADAFNKLPEDQQKEIQENIRTLQQALKRVLEQVPRWRFSITWRR
jgi:hypothetical protein